MFCWAFRRMRVPTPSGARFARERDSTIRTRARDRRSTGFVATAFYPHVQEDPIAGSNNTTPTFLRRAIQRRPHPLLVVVQLRERHPSGGAGVSRSRSERIFVTMVLCLLLRPCGTSAWTRGLKFSTCFVRAIRPRNLKTNETCFVVWLPVDLS